MEVWNYSQLMARDQITLSAFRGEGRRDGPGKLRTADLSLCEVSGNLGD